MPKRPDQKNLDWLFEHGKKIRYGTSLILITWKDGWIASLEVENIREVSKAPLEFKQVNDD